MGNLPINEMKAIGEIKQCKTLVDLFYRMKYQKNIKARMLSDIRKIKSKEHIKRFYQELSLFDLADLEYYPKELMSIIYGNIFANEYLVKDYVHFNSRGISMQNIILLQSILRDVTIQEKCNLLLGILNHIANFVHENENNYWKIIFESLTNEKFLEKRLRFTHTDILNIYYKIKRKYINISYYWLQLGITEQKMKKFDIAKNHLEMAEQIKPYAYQIQHAIARNYLKESLNIGNEEEARIVFDVGERRILSLINGKERYKAKAKDFSIHCYITEWIKFRKIYNCNLSKREAEKIKGYMDLISDKNSTYYKDIKKKLMVFFLSKNIQGGISLTIEDIGIIYDSDNMEDYVLNSY